MHERKTHAELEQEIIKLKRTIQKCEWLDEHQKREHQERLKFEELLTELSAIFIRMPPEEVDQKVEKVFEKLSKLIGLERVDFVQMNQESGEISFSRSWSLYGAESLQAAKFSEIFPWLDKKLKSDSSTILIEDLEKLPKEATVDLQMIEKLGVKSGLIIPHHTNGRLLYAVGLGTHRQFHLPWSKELIQRLKLLGEIIFNATHRYRQEIELRKSLDEIKTLKNQLERENIFLRQEIVAIQDHHAIIGESKAIKGILKLIKKVAPTESTVLITGETGTGKELVARAIHEQSPRRNRTMVTVNCAALPSSLVESELFGRDKGAYTGAMSRQPGRFEIADGSTIFLDEIGELPLNLQVKLLRVLQEGRFERLGSAASLVVDVRVIAATNRDLNLAVEKQQFRKDLFYRLNVFPLDIPPLRERPGDILPLTWKFVSELSAKMGKRVDVINRASLDAMQKYAWPGNVRELKNLIERAMIVHSGTVLDIKVPTKQHTVSAKNPTLKDYERKYILDILHSTNWKIRGKGGAAEILGLKPTTLYSRMEKMNIKRPQ